MKGVIFWNLSFGARFLPSLPCWVLPVEDREQLSILSLMHKASPNENAGILCALKSFTAASIWVFCWLLGSLWELLCSLGKSVVHPWRKDRAFRKWGCQGHTLTCAVLDLNPECYFSFWFLLFSPVFPFFFPFPWNSPLILLLFDLLRTAFWKKSWDKLSIYSLKYSVQ